MRVHTKFLAAVAGQANLPPAQLPEVAFLGRSNVGKSSLLNSLLGEKVARTSSTPGRTRTINFFEIRRPGQPRGELIFADLPGYGYAHVSREIQAEWPKFIEPYLVQRPSLSICLVDANLAPQDSDRQMLEWLRHYRRRFLVVATKADRASGNELANNLRRLSQELREEQILPYSARTGQGKNELWREILAAVRSESPRSAVLTGSEPA